jgi:CheY-like chemotaxis protein
MIETRKLVVVADDYDDVASVLAALIEDSGPYEAIPATDGQEALELSLERQPAAAVLDVDMPVMDGIVAAQAIRDALCDQRPLLIAATGGALTEQAMMHGVFDHVLRKPIDIDELIRLLAAI